MTLGVDERCEEGRTWIEMELVRQTLIAVEKMKKNGDCIAEGELGDAATVFVTRKSRGKVCFAINKEENILK